MTAAGADLRSLVAVTGVAWSGCRGVASLVTVCVRAQALPLLVVVSVGVVVDDDAAAAAADHDDGRRDGTGGGRVSVLLCG